MKEESEKLLKGHTPNAWDIKVLSQKLEHKIDSMDTKLSITLENLYHNQIKVLGILLISFIFVITIVPFLWYALYLICFA